MDNPYLFQTVKDRVDIVEAAEHYGLKPDRHGKCLCPFHNEKTASFHLRNNRYACYGCNAGGDVLDLVGGLLNIGPLEAAKELNAAFGLGIDLDAPVDTEAVAKAQAERREKERFKQWRNGAIAALTEHYRGLHLAKVHGDTRDPEKGVSDRYAHAVREIDKIGYYLDLVCYGSEVGLRDAAPVIDSVVARIKLGQEAGAWADRSNRD